MQCLWPLLGVKCFQFVRNDTNRQRNKWILVSELITRENLKYLEHLISKETWLFHKRHFWPRSEEVWLKTPQRPTMSIRTELYYSRHSPNQHATLLNREIAINRCFSACTCYVGTASVKLLLFPHHLPGPSHSLSLQILFVHVYFHLSIYYGQINNHMGISSLMN